MKRQLKYKHTNIGSFDNLSHKGSIIIDGKRIRIKVVPDPNKQTKNEYVIRARREDLLAAEFYYPGWDEDRDMLPLISFKGLKNVF